MHINILQTKKKANNVSVFYHESFILQFKISTESLPFESTTTTNPRLKLTVVSFLLLKFQ